MTHNPQKQISNYCNISKLQTNKNTQTSLKIILI